MLVREVVERARDSAAPPRKELAQVRAAIGSFMAATADLDSGSSNTTWGPPRGEA